MKLRFLSLFTLVAIIFTSCSKNEELNEPISADLETSRSFQSSITNVTHVYDYYGESIRVEYQFDNEKEDVVAVQGDTERAEALFRDQENAPKGFVFEEMEEYRESTGLAESIELRIKLFNLAEEADEYVASTYQVPAEKGEANRGPCSNLDIGGTGNFYYYKHINYVSEMTSLRRTNRYFSRNYWVGSANNDQLSSLIALKPTNKRALVGLYEHSCFNGKSIWFYQGYGYGGFGVSNLKWYTLSGWWFWRTSWNDQVSSMFMYSY